MIRRVSMSTQVAALTRVPLVNYTRWALAVTAAAMPLYVVRWRVGPVPTTLLENLILITVALYALTVWRHHAPLPRRTPYDIPIAIFLVAGAIGIFVAPDHRGALGIFRAYLIEPVAMYYIAIAVLETTAAIASVLAACAAGAIVFALIEIASFTYALVTGTLQPGHATAALGINPNSVALYLEPLIGMAAGFALFAQGRQRRLAVVVFVALVAAELCTLSRGGLLALAALAFVALLTVRAPALRIGVAVAAIGGAIALWRLPIMGSRLAHSLDPGQGTVWGRERIWVASFRMFHDHPIFGAGLNAYQTVMAPYRAADPNQVPEPYPHNIVLAAWTETGLLGLFAFMYILIGLVVQPWRVFARAVGFHRALLWGLGSAFVMIVVHGLVDTPYWKNDMSLEFWLLAAFEVLAITAVRLQAPARD